MSLTKLSEEQEKRLREIAPGGTKYNMKRDKVFHEQLQDVQLDLEGKSHITDFCLFQENDPELIDIMLSGNVNDLLNFKSPKENAQKKEKNEFKSVASFVFKELAEKTRQYSSGAYITHQIRTKRTARKIMKAISKFKQEGKRITISSISRESGVSRRQISRSYSYLFRDDA